MSQFFTSGGQSIGVSASALVLPMNISDRFPLGWTGWISLQWMNEWSQSVFPKALQQVYYPSYFTNKKTRHREADGFVQSPKARKQQRWHASPAVARNAPGSISSSSCLQTEASSLTLPVFFFWLHPMARRIPSPGVKPASPALQGRFLTTRPSGKSWTSFLSQIFLVRKLPLLKSGRTLWGLSQVQKSFCVLFLFCRKRSQPPRPSLSSKGQIQTVTN